MRASGSIVFAGITIVAGLALLIYALLTPSTANGGHMGFGDSQSLYPALNLVLAILGGILVTAGSMFILLRERKEAVQQPAPPPPVSVSAAHPSGSEVMEEPRKREEDLVLRLLEGDERRMYEAIVSSNGEALQKDLILRTRMSNAKASRVIDRLEQRGLIVKERYGATNRIKTKSF